jgi:hypothetical protein
MNVVTVLDLEQWSNRTGSRTRLAGLVASLIRATAEVSYIRFPSGDSGERKGYDGHLESSGFDQFVPRGKSVWEFGTSGRSSQSKIKEKAEGDYQRRTREPKDADPKETVFVVVTSRPWDGAREWASLKRKDGNWADVRAVDAVLLENWLREAPAVAFDFAKEIGLLPPSGIISLQEYWKEIAARTTPPLTEHVFLAGRMHEAQQVRESLGGLADQLVIQGDSKDEVLAFVAAALRTPDGEGRDVFLSRTVVVNDDEVARSLPNSVKLIIGLRESPYLGGYLVTQGHHVILPLGNDAGKQRNTRFRLPRPCREDFVAALEFMGLDAQEAEQLSRECGRSVTILQRRRPSAAFDPPPWAVDNRLHQTLIPAMFAGAWDHNSQADRKVLEMLADRPYSELEESVLQLARISDPPIERIGQVWAVTAPVDAFELLAGFVSERQLSRFESAVHHVFSEIDQTLQQAPEKRSYAPLRGQGLRHSAWLRHGLAESVLMIAVLGEGRITSVPDSQTFADSLIVRLEGLRSDYRLMASLQAQLPVVMEAAPRPLLRALEHLLEGHTEALKGIFTESGFLAPSSFHTGVLWALETLAWDPEYLERVAIILAKLSEIDPGGQLANRPLRSLREIFLPWHPGTNASHAEQLRVIDRIVAECPAIAWEFLISLLPRRGDHSIPTRRPLWREAGASEDKIPTRRDLWDMTHKIIDRVLVNVGINPARWKNVLDSLADFPPEDRSRVYETLVALDPTSLSDEVRNVLWSAIRETVARHTRFTQAEWAITRAELKRLGEVESRLLPSSAISRNRWLFDDYYPTVEHRSHDESWAEIERLRDTAIKEILEEKGSTGILSLASTVKHVDLLVRPLATILSFSMAIRLIDSASGSEDDKLRQFAADMSAVAAQKFDKEFKDWIRERRQKWDTERLVNCLARWRDDIDTWGFISEFGDEIENLYWRNKPVWPVAKAEDISFVISKYLSVNRAVEVISIMHDVSDLEDVEVIFRLLDASIEEINTNKFVSYQSFPIQVEKILSKLSERTDVSEFEVAKREYAYLPILDSRQKTLTVHRLLAKDPQFFVQSLRDAFRGSSDPRETAEPTKSESDRARFAYRLLNSWTTLPGYTGEGDFDAEELWRWVRRARQLCTAEDLEALGDLQIGNVFAHAPGDLTDGLWPHGAVRRVIEEVASKELERGMMIGRFNRRGVVMKSPFEGGDQERKLADEARKAARLLADWPRTSRVLKEIAKEWDRQAKGEDERAEQMKARGM